jgi:hypothetical protein
MLSFRIAGTGKRKDLTPLITSDLGHDVGGGAEPVQPEALCVVRKDQRTVADEPGAKERRCLQVGITVRDRETEPVVGYGVLGIAAINLVPGKRCVVAKVLSAAFAVATPAASKT